MVVKQFRGQSRSAYPMERIEKQENAYYLVKRVKDGLWETKLTNFVFLINDVTYDEETGITEFRMELYGEGIGKEFDIYLPSTDLVKPAIIQQRILEKRPHFIPVLPSENLWHWIVEMEMEEFNNYG